MPDTAQVMMDDGQGGLLPIDEPHIASRKEKAEAGRDENESIVVVPWKTGFDE